MTREDKIRVSAIGYALITLTPLFVVLIGPTAPQRGFWIEFAVALGFIGLAMLGLQSVLTARFPRISGTFGQDALLQFHRQAGIVAFGFVLAHPIILLLANGDYWAFLDLRDNFLRAAFLIIVLIGLVHITRVSYYLESFWKQALWVVIGSASIGSVLYVRAIKPLRVRRHPDRITSVDPLTATPPSRSKSIHSPSPRAPGAATVSSSQ